MVGLILTILISLIRVGSELGKMCQSSLAELSSSSAVLKVWPPDPWVFLRFFQKI